MGGFGSGRWERSHRKTTVEESLVINFDDLRNHMRADVLIRIYWMSNGETLNAINYFMMSNENGPIVCLAYCYAGEEVLLPIELQTSSTNHRGRRLWFTCPLTINGEKCDRRVGKLYLPPSSKYFGCRTCHDLTYTSSQQAHYEDRIDGRIESMAKFLEKRGVDISSMNEFN